MGYWSVNIVGYCIVVIDVLSDLEMLPRLGTIIQGDFGSIDTFIRRIRIYSTSRLNHSPSKRLFNRIVVVIIESAAAYSLILLLYAIIFAIPSVGVFGSPLSEADYYMEAIVTVAAGMAPTILVARMATNHNHTVTSSAITHISGLQFGPQQGSGSGHSENTTGGDINASVHANDANPSPMIELKKETSADASFEGNRV
ncbi:hypothetical protein CVT25_007704 [Psilocybe cyanescens]|uniref:Uncharacterized protein n=1 Tax=Psilocybe cyanescens TaxID=93625 RepID=A0A409XV83_PSICY|nr:hypothetical protein CVT25_007704 [Psilocybe cyanescens]